MPPKAKIISLFPKVLKGVTTFSAVFGACAIIWATSAYFTKKDFTQKDLTEKVETIIVNQKDNVRTDSILLFKINNLNGLQDKVNGVAKSQEKLTVAVQRFITNNKFATKEDLKNFVEDTKKNVNYYPTQTQSKSILLVDQILTSK